MGLHGSIINDHLDNIFTTAKIQMIELLVSGQRGDYQNNQNLIVSDPVICIPDRGF